MPSTTTPCRTPGSIRFADLPDYMDKPEVAIEYYGINTTKPPMNDLRVRKAFNLAVDKNALAEYRRVVKPLTSFTPEGIFPKYPRPTRRRLRSAARARCCWRKRAIAMRTASSTRRNFPRAPLEILYNTTESNKQTAEFVQAQWKQNLGHHRAAEEHGVEDVPGRARQASVQRLRAAGLDRGLHGSVLVPGSVLDAHGRERHGLVRSEVRDDAGRQPIASPIRRSVTSSWRRPKRTCWKRSRSFRFRRRAATG